MSEILTPNEYMIVVTSWIKDDEHQQAAIAHDAALRARVEELENSFRAQTDLRIKDVLTDMEREKWLIRELAFAKQVPAEFVEDALNRAMRENHSFREVGGGKA